MGFRLVPKSVTLMTLNGVWPCILPYFAEFCSFWVYYVKVVEDTPIHSSSEM